MDSIYITDARYHKFDRREPQIPRDRYITYVKDLHKLYQSEVTESTFMEGSQYTYAEMGSLLLDQLAQQHQLSTIDQMIISYWVQEYDPEYAACGPYFAEKYAITGSIFDVSDQGSIGPHTGIEIIKQFQLNSPHHKSVLMALEQTSVPRNINSHDVIPTVDAGFVLLLEKNLNFTLKNNKHGFKLIANQLLQDQDFLHRGINTLKLIESLCQKHKIPTSQLQIGIKKTSYLWKSLQYYIAQNSAPIELHIQPYDYRPGCIAAFEYICDQFKTPSAFANYHLIFDEDVESLASAYLLLERMR